MALIVNRTDGEWLQFLLFTQPRPSPLGPADGMFYGLLSEFGDASGDPFTLNGILSVARKQDYVFNIKTLSCNVFSNVGGKVQFAITSGPVIPNPSTQDNVIFTQIQDLESSPSLSEASLSNVGPGLVPQDITVFGDRHIAGTQTMLRVRFSLNTNNVIHSASVQGFIYRQQSFFRGVPPSLG